MTKPTRAWVEKTIRDWTQRLGLVEWRIVMDWDTPAPEGAYASVWKSGDYALARIHLDHDWWHTADRDELEAILVHELLHVHLRNLSRANDYACKPLKNKERAIAYAAWDHAEEAVVDRLARSLVKAWKA